MAAGNVVITSSDAAWAWTNTSGHNTITIEAIGGGGGGGGENGYPADGGGGKGGSYCRKKITKAGETTLNIVVGSAGTAGNGGNGGNGGASKITQGVTVVFLAPGGEGGKGGTADNHSGAGGQTECDGATNPATAIYGTHHFAGGNGAAGVYSTHYSGGGGGAAGPGGVGGAASGVTAGTGDAANFLNSTHYSGDGAAGKGTAESDGAAPASLNGGGGSGGNATDNTNHPGGAGRIGIVVISWVDPVNVSVSATCPSLTATTYSATVTVPVIATITGSATESITEADIVTGGKQIIITLTGDTLISGAPVSAVMKQKIMIGFSGTMNVSAARYVQLASGAAPLSTEYLQLVPTAGTIRNLRVLLKDDPTTATSYFRFTVRQGSGGTATTAHTVADTALTVDVNAGETYKSDTTHSFHVAAGDTISLKFQGFNGPAASNYVSAQVEFESDTANEAVLISSANGAISTSATNYIGVHAGLAAGTSAWTPQIVMPLAGTITAFYGRINAAAGGSGNTRTFKISQNGTPNDTTALNFDDASKLAVNVTGLSIAVSAGDRLVIESTIGGTPAAVSSGAFGILFKPTINGQFPIVYVGGATALNGGETKYFSMANALDIQATEILFTLGYNDYVIKNVWAYLDANPGVGKSMVVQPRIRTGPGNASNPGAITLTNTQGPLSATGDLTPSQFEGYGTSATLDAASTAARIAISYTGYIAP